MKITDINSAPKKSSFEEISLEIAKLLEQKNKAYGDNNLVKYGMFGVIVRLSDKLARLENISNLKKDEYDESIEDTLKDIAGYAINALRLKREGRL